MTRKPNGFYTDDLIVTALAIFIVLAWTYLIFALVKWVMELPK